MSFENLEHVHNFHKEHIHKQAKDGDREQHEEYDWDVLYHELGLESYGGEG